MTKITKSAPIGREAALVRTIDAAIKMGEPELAAPEIAELKALRAARFAREDAELDRMLVGLSRMFNLPRPSWVR